MIILGHRQYQLRYYEVLERQTSDHKIRGGKNWSSSSRMNNDPESQQIRPQPEGGDGSRRGRRKRYPREVSN